MNADIAFVQPHMLRPTLYTLLPPSSPLISTTTIGQCCVRLLLGRCPLLVVAEQMCSQCNGGGASRSEEGGGNIGGRENGEWAWPRAGWGEMDGWLDGAARRFHCCCYCCCCCRGCCGYEATTTHSLLPLSSPTPLPCWPVLTAASPPPPVSRFLTSFSQAFVCCLHLPSQRLPAPAPLHSYYPLPMDPSRCSSLLCEGRGRLEAVWPFFNPPTPLLTLTIPC